MSTNQESHPAQTEKPPETDNADPNVNKTPPAENEKPLETDDPKALNDPNLNKPPPAQNETPPETDNPKALKDPNIDETPPETQTQIPSEKQPTAEAVETLSKQASAPDLDPHVQKVTPHENELTTSKDSSSSHPNYVPTQTTATHEPETDENKKSLRNEFPINDANPHRPVHEISPADDETSSKQLSLPEISPTDDKTTSTQLSLTKNDFSENDGPKTSCSDSIKQDSFKKSKWWEKIRLLFNQGVLFRKLQKGSQPKSSIPMIQEPEEPSKLTKAIQDDIESVEKGGKMLDDYKKQLNSLLQASKKIEDRQDNRQMKEDLHRLKQDLIKLELQVSRMYKVGFDGSPKKVQSGSETKRSIRDEVLNMMPRLHKNVIFESSPEFKDFEARYDNLGREQKLCLLCFSVFPEYEIVKKRVMVQWWVSEGFASEVDANEYFLQLIEKGFIEPVNDNRSLSVGSCRMHPFYRSALVTLAERTKFLNFDDEGGPTQNFSESFQACLVGQGLISYDDLKKSLVTIDDLEKIHLLINVNESILEFKREWFAKMKNVNFLYLGRWGASATEHREVEDTAFLDELENMSFVKFLSLQGVSNIIDLPESILKLRYLEVLDVRACQNLEKIPDGIGQLKNLTHLDMSECYLLEHMPKSLSSLQRLKVLKGFVVCKSPRKKACTLDDLKELKNLIKLSIYTDFGGFPDQNNIEALQKLTRLIKLTITWAGSAFHTATDVEKKNGSSSTTTAGLPLNLQKLDLRYFPTPTTPDWLALKNVKKLKELKKLYIRGGRFSDIGQYQDSDNWDWPLKKDTWTVEILRLKYLPEIEMEWRQVQELFPDLVYLERVECPKLNLFPCDANGVWINKRSK